MIMQAWAAMAPVQPPLDGAVVGHDSTAPGSWFGWPTAPRLEELRRDWLMAADFARRREICGEIQAQVWRDVPFLPLG